MLIRPHRFDELDIIEVYVVVIVNARVEVHAGIRVRGFLHGELETVGVVLRRDVERLMMVRRLRGRSRVDGSLDGTPGVGPSIEGEPVSFALHDAHAFMTQLDIECFQAAKHDIRMIGAVANCPSRCGMAWA